MQKPKNKKSQRKNPAGQGEPAKKKRKVPSPEPADDTSDTSEDGFPEQDDSDGESIEDEEVQVDFGFHDPEDSDFHGLKAIVHQYLDGKDLDSSLLSNHIIDDLQVATCLRTGEDCVGVAAVIPLQTCRDAAFSKQILKHWSAKADAACKPKLSAAAAAAGTAILLSERVINAPPEVSAPLMGGLAKDLRVCRQHSDDAELAPYAALTQFLVCAKAYVDGGVGADRSGGIQVSARASTSAPTPAVKEGEVVFLRPEDEVFHKHCDWSCSWAVHKTGEYEKDVSYRRVLMLLSSKGFEKSVKEVAKMFDHDLRQHDNS